MALSDYVHMVFDGNGKPIETCKFKNGITLQPYKNWIYIHHAEMWKALKNPMFIEDTIAQFSSGTMTLGDVTIEAEPLKNANGMMFYALASHYEKDKPATYERFSGIVSYGWKNSIKFYLEKLGRLAEYDQFEWMESSTGDGKGGSIHSIDKLPKDFGDYKPIETITITDYNYDDLWQGISPEMLAEFHEFITRVAGEHSHEAYANLVKSADASFVNSGDAFFAKALGFKASKTKVKTKKKKQPLLMRSLSQKKRAKHQLKHK